MQQDKITEHRAAYIELLNLIHRDVVKPYDECHLKSQRFVEIPVTTDPRKLESVVTGEQTLEKFQSGGTLGYSQMFHLSLKELSELLEDHPLGKESWPSGNLTDNFAEAIGILDAMHDQTGCLGKEMVLVQNRTNAESPDYVGRLILYCPNTLHPSIRILKYVDVESDQKEKSKFCCELSISLSRSHSYEIGKDMIIPYGYGNHFSLMHHLNPQCLVGQRINEEDNRRLDENDLKLYRGRSQILSVVKKAIKKPLYYAIKDIVKRHTVRLS